MKNGRISGYFSTKYMTVEQIKPILHNFEDQKSVNVIIRTVPLHSAFTYICTSFFLKRNRVKKIIGESCATPPQSSEGGLE